MGCTTSKLLDIDCCKRYIDFVIADIELTRGEIILELKTINNLEKEKEFKTIDDEYSKFNLNLHGCTKKHINQIKDDIDSFRLKYKNFRNSLVQKSSMNNYIQHCNDKERNTK